MKAKNFRQQWLEVAEKQIEFKRKTNYSLLKPYLGKKVVIYEDYGRTSISRYHQLTGIVRRKKNCSTEFRIQKNKVNFFCVQFSEVISIKLV
ncbi:MAG: hypothetical protein WC499_02010 [Patescibacteria group bacterium]